MKKILGLLVLVLVVAAGVAYMRLGSIVRGAVQTYGSRMLGVPVRVGLVTISPFSGKGSLHNLVIGNPDGFTAPNAIKLHDLEVAVDLKSLRGPVLRIKEIVLDGPEVTLEGGVTGTNLQRLQKNLASYSPSEPEEAKKTEGRKMVIERLLVRKGKVTAIVPALKSEPYSAALPDVELTGIGAKSGGATAAQASKQVLDAVAKKAVQGAGGREALLKKGLEAVGGPEADEALDKVKGLFK